MGWNGAEKGYFVADKKNAIRPVEQGKKVCFRPDKKSRKPPGETGEKGAFSAG